MISSWLSALVMAGSVVAFPDGLEWKDQDYPFKYYSRQDWNASASTDTRPLNTPVPYVVIHHTYIPEACHAVEECKKSMKSMQIYHNTLDFGDIGYNFCVGSEGGAYEGRGWEVVGVHAGPANNFSIGICLIGDWRTELPPQTQLETTKQLIEVGVSKGIISPEYKLVGHRQAMINHTECPGGALFDHISTWDHFSPVFEVPTKKSDENANIVQGVYNRGIRG